MKKISLCLLLFCIAITAHAQSVDKVTDENYGKILAEPMNYPLMQVWKAYEQKQDYKLRHDDTNAANKQSENDVEEFEGEDELLLRGLRFYMDRLDSNGMIIPWNIKAAEAYQDYKTTQAANKLAGGVTANWKQLGPLKADHAGSGIGRIDCIAVDPTNDNIMYAGSPSGGLWKTTNYGQLWECLTNSIEEPIGVSSIVIDPTNPQFIYFVSGDKDSYFPSTFFGGMYKSIDGGITWTKSTSGLFSSLRAIKLVMHPINHNKLLLLARDELFYSNDAGANWTQGTLNNGGERLFDIALVPGQADKILVLALKLINNKQTLQIFSSDAFGNNPFIPIGTAPFEETANNYKILNAKLAVYPTIANRFYVAYDQIFDDLKDSTTFGKLKVSVDGGNVWSELIKNTYNSNTHLCDSNLLGNLRFFPKSQSKYTFTLSIDPQVPADPADADIYIGGLHLYKSTKNNNGAISFNLFGAADGTSNSYIHADQHCTLFNNAKEVIAGNDGGVYLRADKEVGGKWEFKSNGLAVSEIYNTFIDNSTDFHYWLALQDNGGGYFNTSGTSEKKYIHVFQNDGLEIAKANNMVYDIAQLQTIFKQDLNKPEVIDDISVKLNVGCSLPIFKKSVWNSSILTNRLNDKQVVMGESSLYYTENAGANWQCSFNQVGGKFNPDPITQTTLVRKIVRSLSNPKKIYAVMQIVGDAKVYSSHSSSSMLLISDKSGKDFKKVSAPFTPNITSIAVGRWNNKEVVFGGCADASDPANKFYIHQDNPSLWINLSAGLPNVPINCIVYDTTSIANDIYVGTDMGVYYRNENDNWIEFNSDMPKCLVTDLDIDYDNHTLVASTFGRGLWQSDLVSANEIEIESEGGFTMCGTGESMELKVIGGNGIAYLWDNSSTNRTRTITGPGTYSVTVTLQNSATVTSTATASIKIGSEADKFFVGWEKTYNDGGNHQQGVGIVTENNHAYFVADTYKNGFPDIFIGAINDRGKLLWQKTMGGPKSDRAGGLCIAQTGRIMIGATSFGSGGDVPSPDVTAGNLNMNWVFKLDATSGEVVKKANGTPFNRTYSHATQNNHLTSIKKGPGDEIYFANSYNNVNKQTDQDFSIFKINGTTSAGSIVSTYSAKYNDQINDMAFVPVNGQNIIYVTGDAEFDTSETTSDFAQSYWSVKFGKEKPFQTMYKSAFGLLSNQVGWTIGLKVPSNSIECNSVFAGEKSSYGSAITGSLDNNIYLTGQSSCVGFHMATVTKFGGNDIYVRKQRLDGQKHTWVASAGGNKDDYSKAILTTIDNGVIIAGGTNSDSADCGGYTGKGNGDIFIAAFDNNGVKTGTLLLGSNGFDEAASLAWTPDSSYFYLCGTTTIQQGDADVYIAKITCNTCPKPYKNLKTDPIAKNNATIKWNKRACSNDYEVWYRKTNSTDAYFKTLVSGEQLPVAGLTEGTEYEWKVRSKCANGNYSIFSPMQHFTTPSIRDGIELTAHVDFEASLYPNPSNGNFSIDINAVQDGIASITILDGTGRIVGEKSMNVIEGANVFDYNDSGLAQGIYFVRVAIGQQAKLIRVAVY